MKLLKAFAIGAAAAAGYLTCVALLAHLDGVDQPCHCDTEVREVVICP